MSKVTRIIAEEEFLQHRHSVEVHMEILQLFQHLCDEIIIPAHWDDFEVLEGVNTEMYQLDVFPHTKHLSLDLVEIVMRVLQHQSTILTAQVWDSLRCDELVPGSVRTLDFQQNPVVHDSVWRAGKEGHFLRQEQTTLLGLAACFLFILLNSHFLIHAAMVAGRARKLSVQDEPLSSFLLVCSLCQFTDSAKL